MLFAAQMEKMATKIVRLLRAAAADMMRELSGIRSA